MPCLRIEPPIVARFPDLALAWTLVEGVTVATSGHPPALALQRAAEADVRARRTVETLKDDAVFRAYRDFYWALGIDPTKTRPSGEALNRRVLNGNQLPSINAFVDAYNAASLATGIAVGAYDADRLASEDVVLRAALPGERFAPLAGEPKQLAGGEVVLADAARIVNFYPYRDADATKVTTETRRALLVACGAPGVDAELLDKAAAHAAAHVLEACGGRISGSGRALAR